MAQRDRGDPAPDRGVRIGLDIGPPCAGSFAELLGQLRDLGAFEEADTRERELARQDRIEQTCDLGSLLPAREGSFARRAELSCELAADPIATEVDAKIWGDHLRGDPRFAKFAAQGELAVELFQDAIGG